MDEHKKKQALETFGAEYRTKEEFWAELRDMVLVAESNEGGGYDWDVLYIYWHTKRERYYLISGSGCSCNWISDNVDRLGDFEDYPDKTVLKNAVRRDFAWWSNTRVLNVISQIENFNKREV